MAPPEDRLRRTRARIERHSRLVRWMKIALPIVGLLLVAAIFLAGRERGDRLDPGTAAGMAAMSTGMRIDNPRFSGVTDAGDPFVVIADSAEPEGAVPNRIDLENPVGELQMSERGVTVTADRGVLFRDEEQVNLEGDVVLVTSDGYRVEAPAVRVYLETKTAVAPERMRAIGPNGSIEADSVQLVRGDDDALTVRFEGDVRVDWRPAGNAGEDR